MPFEPIVLTREGDALIFPERQKLLDSRMLEQRSFLKIPPDLEALELGKYPTEKMVSASSRNVIGGPRYRQQGTTYGMHRTCGGEFDLRVVTETHQAIICHLCHLRVPIPKTINTYGKLRAHAKEVLLAVRT